MKLSRLFKSTLSIASFAFLFTFAFSSCCEESELTIKDLEVCSEKPADLDSATCDDNLSELGVEDNITFSVVVFAAETDSKITSKLYVEENGSYVLVESLTEEKSLSDFEGKCGVRVADGWSPASGNQWPEANIRIEVELNSDPPQLISKDVQIRN